MHLQAAIILSLCIRKTQRQIFKPLDYPIMEPITRYIGKVTLF